MSLAALTFCLCSCRSLLCPCADAPLPFRLLKRHIRHFSLDSHQASFPPPQSCLLLSYETSLCIHGVCSGVRLGFSSSISCADCQNLSKLSVYLRLCDCFCFILFIRGREKQTGLDLTGKSECGAGWGQTLKLMVYLNPSCYATLPKAFEGII